MLSNDMVLAILDGRKTQTRRPLKPQPDSVHDGAPYWNVWKRGNLAPLKCPFGQVGDRLWVRETFCLEHQVEDGQPPPFDDGRPMGGGRRYSPSPRLNPEAELSHENIPLNRAGDNLHEILRSGHSSDNLLQDLRS